ncbi:LssY C-terminal domain-containing protein [Salinisphaera hydrothermalis]|uniref:DedA family protein n=1 Tax=Salinisphaera hydrothermalis (strain C41B8) TaxID=1304275 RepID=A0A084IR66_SALHC|nr:LssY C-terminal domain-containing protein [Salinisphaera hydrothermalis]KEZ79200.1 DedA family protein [Salinisphaera hydrothermalis C41B8]
MAHEIIAGILAWVSAHPTLALAVVFAVAVAESLFLFGLLIPGAIFMFAFGALIGSDALAAVPTFAAAVIGTILGDSASYALGRRYRGRLHALPGLSRIPGGVARGEAFFARHGGKGIVLGRLIGALRPVMPTVAGAAGLSITRFAVMEVIASALWAPIYIGPGVVFGASLDLAAQVATRLAILLIGASAIVWALTSLARLLVVAGRSAGRRYAERLMSWSRRHRRLGLLGPALADPRQPEIPALAVAAAVLMAAVAILYLGLWGWAGPRYPTTFDALAFYLIASLHNAPTDMVARLVAELGSPLVYLPFAAAIGLTLSLMGNWRAAAHWIVAVGFSAAVTLLLRWLLAIPPPAVYFQLAAVDPMYLAGGGQDLILCATVYGLAGMIVGARQPLDLRPYYYSATVAGVVLIALARLYLGLDWASDSLIGLGVAFVWINLLMIGFRRQRPRRIRGRPVLTALGVCVVFAGLLVLLPGGALHDLPGRLGAPIAGPAQVVDDWAGGGYAELPAHIQTLRGRNGAPLNVQAAGDLAAVHAALFDAGWRPPTQLGAGSALRSLAPDTPIDALPVLPRVHQGRRPALVLTHPIDGSPGRRWVLRLWATARVTGHGHRPIWVGMIDGQHVGHELQMLTTARDEMDYRAASAFLAANLASHGIDHRSVSRDGFTRILLWPRALDGDAKVWPPQGLLN